MARNRTDTKLLSLRGTFAHDPDRARERAGEPDPEGPIGDPPSYLSPKEVECWNDLVQLAHRDTLCRADRVIVEHGARAWSALREVKSYNKARPELMVRLEMCLQRLGMSPADRSRVKVLKKPAKANPFAEFAA